MKKFLSLLLVMTMLITSISVFATDAQSTVTHPVKDGDYVDVAIYKNLYPHTEAYAKFNTLKAEPQIPQTV